MVTPIQELPPVASASGLNLYTLFKSPSETLQEKMTKEIQKAADNTESKDEEHLKSNNSDTQKNKVSDFTVIEEKLREITSDLNLDLQISLDKQTKDMVIKLVDPQTKEVVRQYPAEVSLKIAKTIANIIDSGNVTNARI